MAQWMDQHFKTATAPPAARVAPKSGPGFGWVVVVGAILVAAGGAAYWMLMRQAEPGTPAMQAVAATQPPARTRPAVAAPAVAPATLAPASVAPAPTPPKGMADLIERVDELRLARAKHLRWLDECEVEGHVPAARQAVAAARNEHKDKWSAEVRLNNLLADIKSHQQEVARLDDLCTSAERRLIETCQKVGYPPPLVANPQTTFNGNQTREKKRPHIGPAPTPLVRQRR